MEGRVDERRATGRPSVITGLDTCWSPVEEIKARTTDRKSVDQMRGTGSSLLEPRAQQRVLYLSLMIGAIFSYLISRRKQTLLQPLFFPKLSVWMVRRSPH